MTIKGIIMVTGLLFNLSRADFQVHLLQESDGFITGSLMDSLLLSFPPCSLASKSVTLEYNRTDSSSEHKILANIFTVPPCRFKRNVITAVENNGTRQLGYQVTNLTVGANYRLQVMVGTERSNILVATTSKIQDYNLIEEDLSAHSAAMIIITVILSLTMSVLPGALIVAFSLGIK